MKKKNFNSRSIAVGLALLLVPVAFMLLFYFIPLGSILPRVFRDYAFQGEINWVRIAKVFWFTSWQAAVSTLLTLIAGLPITWIFSRFRFRGKKFFRSLFSVPFILPTVVTAAAFNALIGPTGWINNLLSGRFGFGSAQPIRLMNTIWIILLAHIFYNISVVIRMVGNAWNGIDSRIEDAAATLGCSRWQIFWKVTLPLLKPALISAILLIFLFDFTSYGVVLLLGGVKFRTVEVEIYQQALLFFNLPMAGLLSILQIAITVLITFAESLISRSDRAGRIPRIQDENLRKPAGLALTGTIPGVLAFGTIFLASPMIALLLRSLTIFPSGVRGGKPQWTLDFYRQLFINSRNSFFYVPPIQAVTNSLTTALMAALIAVMIGLLISIAADRYPWTKRINPLFMFPLGTSSVTLGLGYLMFFSHNIKNPLLIPFAHSLISLPFVIRSLRPLLGNIPVSIRQAGAMLGAGPIIIFFRIDLPIIIRGIINAAIFSFTISLGEFGATSFLTVPEKPTIPIAIFRFLGQPGVINYGQAMAMSTILMLLCLVGMLIFEYKPSKSVDGQDFI